MRVSGTIMSSGRKFPDRTDVVIVGGGPAGLLLARKLIRSGIGCMILERRSRSYVLSRIRAGVLEQGSVDQLRESDVSQRLDQEGLVHGGCLFADDCCHFRVDFAKLVGKSVTVYGQTEVTRDLYRALDADGVPILHEVEGVRLHDIATESPSVTFQRSGNAHRVACSHIAGCDGFHGISRGHIPDGVRQQFDRSFPFGWLGVLSESPPVSDELIYSRSGRGFALASMRNPKLSRYYLQVPLSENADDWSADQFWAELRRRLPEEFGQALETGKVVEKSVTPIRGFVSEPMSYGTLFLCGDSSHIVPPTGAKGLNLAFSDVHYLHEALVRKHADGDGSMLARYSEAALTRVWKSMRFSWWMTNLLHRIPDADDFERRIQDAEFALIRDTANGRAMLAENYTGLPY